jgi:hypothetical protein
MVLCAPFKVPASIEDYNISSLSFFFLLKLELVLDTWGLSILNL